MPPSYSVDEREFPLVRVHYYDLLPDPEFDRQLADLNRILDREQPHALVIVTHHQRMMPLSQVRKQASNMLESAEKARRWVRGIALVIPSPVIRGVLKVTLSIAPMPCPYAVFDHEDEGVRWARARLGGTGITASI